MTVSSCQLPISNLLYVGNFFRYVMRFLPKAGKLVHNEKNCETVQAENNKTGASYNWTRSLHGAPSTLEAMPKSVHLLPGKQADLGSFMG